MFFFSHGERGERVDSGWGGRGRTAQCPPLRAANQRKREDNRGKKGRRKERERNKEKKLASTY